VSKKKKMIFREAAAMLQLQCRCGRNLARVRWDESNAHYTRDCLVVIPNIGVEFDDYAPRDAAFLHGQAPRDDFDRHDRTYTWRCRCGRTIVRRHEQISTLWSRETRSTFDPEGGLYGAWNPRPDRLGRTAWRAVLAD
jgi:hypothetical protein